MNLRFLNLELEGEGFFLCFPNNFATVFVFLHNSRCKQQVHQLATEVQGAAADHAAMSAGGVGVLDGTIQNPSGPEGRIFGCHDVHGIIPQSSVNAWKH
jgi:hypothetical protein